MGFHRHRRFYIALFLGVVAALLFPGSWGQRVIIIADLFSASYLVLMAHFLLQTAPDDMRSHLGEHDEGIVWILLIALVVIAFSLAAIFVTFNAGKRASFTEVSFALAGLPLGWAMLQTLMALHYARIFYQPQSSGGTAGGLNFADTPEPGPLEFLYYSFTIGMCAQVSDTALTTTAMRRATLGHAVLSFFYNTVILALAVNAAVALSG